MKKYMLLVGLTVCQISCAMEEGFKELNNLLDQIIELKMPSKNLEKIEASNLKVVANNSTLYVHLLKTDQLRLRQDSFSFDMFKKLTDDWQAQLYYYKAGSYAIRALKRDSSEPLPPHLQPVAIWAEKQDSACKAPLKKNLKELKTILAPYTCHTCKETIF